MKNLNKGFIALFSVIIISFVLLLLSISLNFSSLLGRFNILDSEIKEESVETADACVEIARLVRALEDSEIDIAKEAIVNQAEDDEDDRRCWYKFTALDQVEICAEVYDSHTFYNIEFDSNDEVASFEEVASISGMCES